jgi:hypothetical protein
MRIPLPLQIWRSLLHSRQRNTPGDASHTHYLLSDFQSISGCTELAPPIAEQCCLQQLPLCVGLYSQPAGVRLLFIGIPRPSLRGMCALCRLYVSPHRPLQSTIANSTRRPVWDETFQLLVSDYRQDVLTAILYDHDRVTPDERLGRCACP